MLVRWLSASDVARCLSMEAAIEAVRDAFVAVARDAVAMPTRTQLAAERFGGVSLFMPSHAPGLARTALKLVSVYPGNPARGLPAITGVVVLLDAETGVPLALMDARVLTALRTGAASGVATDVLARPDARVLALIGAGAQAPYQALAVCAVRPIREIRIFNRTRQRAEELARRLAAELDRQRPAITVCATPGEAVREADVICTATSATTPVLEAAEVPAGAHVNAVGSFRPEMRELPRDLLRRAGRVFVDQREAALEEAGEIIDALAAGTLDPAGLVEIGAVIAGERPGREGSGEVTIFKSCGLAAQDLYAAARVLAEAEAAGVGRWLEL
ncbi:MAG: ornithine cyclodeaminase [Bacillota bacterium]|nr:MAG: ornithine cyclodeaminase [Bacillota bacterium]